MTDTADTDRPRRGRLPNADPASPVDVATLMQDPTVQALLAAMVEAAVNARVSTMPAAAAMSTDSTFARELAMNLTLLANQNAKIKPLPPEEVIRREKARALMERLIEEAQASDDVPEYKLKAAVYLDEQVVAPIYRDDHTKRQMQTRIGYPLAPNEEMVPINASARRIHAAFMDSIGGTTPNIPEQRVQAARAAAGLKVLHKDREEEVSPVGRPRHRGNLSLRGREVPDEVDDTPIMGNLGGHHDDDDRRYA